MTEQLHLIDPGRPSWRLDEDTRATGRRGVAQARAALVAARRRQRVERDDAVDHDDLPHAA